MTEQERTDTLATIKAQREIMGVLVELLKGVQHPQRVLTEQAHHTMGLIIQELESSACDDDVLKALLDEVYRLDAKLKGVDFNNLKDE